MAELTPKEFLSQAFRIDQRINAKIEQIQSLRELVTKATATLTDMPFGGTRNNHRMEGIIVKMVDLENEINDDLQRLVNLKREIVSIIQSVEAPELQTILEQRYLCYTTWEEIAVKLHIDIRWVHRLHNRALNEIDVIRHTRP
jgi:hypothetical protein